jgi:hypothetical protein
MNFNGPYTPKPEALAALEAKGRMIDVTLDVLEEAGFSSFGWVLPDELPDGHKLCANGEAYVRPAAQMRSAHLLARAML